MTERTQPIRIETEDGSLRLFGRDRVRMRKGDRVVWPFSGVPDGFGVSIGFRSYEPFEELSNPRLREVPPDFLERGPFRELQGMGGEITGEGLPDGRTGLYFFEVFLVDLSNGRKRAVPWANPNVNFGGIEVEDPPP